MSPSSKPEGYTSVSPYLIGRAQDVIEFLVRTFGATPLVDATYRRALEAGGVTVQEPKQHQEDPDWRGGVKDPAGNTWWIATQMTPQEA